MSHVHSFKLLQLENINGTREDSDRKKEDRCEFEVIKENGNRLIEEIS